MKMVRYFIFILSTFIFLNSFAAQQNSKKIKKTNLPAANQSLVSSSKNYSNISARLKSFMNKLGLNPSTTKFYTANKTLTAAVSTKTNGMITLPSPAFLNSNDIKKVILDNKYGTPRLIDVQAPVVQKGKTIQSTGSASTLAMNFMVSNKDLLKISDPANEFKLESTKKDALGMTHIRYEQVYKGLEVWGKEVYVHFDNHGNISSLTGRFAPTPLSIQDISGKKSSSDAISIAVNELKSRMTISGFSNQIQDLLKYHGPSARKIIWYDKQQIPHLAWFAEVRSGLSQDWYYFIDAQNGSILDFYNNVCFDGATTGSGVDLNGVNRTFGTYQVGSGYYMIDASQPMFNSSQSQIPGNPVGAIECLDLRNTDLSSSAQYYYVTSTNNQWSDATSISANYNAITTYNYYRTIQNRNSIDDKGMTIYSIIHVTENGQPMENAFWSGTVMCYGDGGTYFKPLAGGLDVAAHEMTHGVTQHTSNLEYQDQSGALNESMSDVFGKLVDTTSWQIGATVVKDLTTFPSGALRDMSNPHNGGNSGDPSWQPANMTEYVNTTQDNGGVHVNSGIPNYAFYFVASYIGRSSAGKIWYRAETTYLTHSSQFLDARIATEKAATDLFGSTSNELNAVKKAWDNVGVYENTPPPPPPPSQVVGQDWILAVNTDYNTDPNSIYMAKTVVQSSADFSALSQTKVLTRPAVTDTSGLILFVDQNNELRAVYADPNNPQETILDTNSYWWSVAIGPGLSSFALTSKYIDTTIYYFDLVNNTNQAFKIKTPSYDVADTKTALYADAMSFDPTGQYLMFDTFNQIQSSTGDTISYWNINILDVKTGDMESVFPPQAKGIDVGDPSFSKTSQTRFTFDYWNTNNNTYQVLAADFNTGKSALVASTSALGFPSYSGDDKTIVYHDKQTVSSALHDVLQQMTLQSDLITGTGTSTSYVVDATFPVWFVIGNRITDVKNEPETIPQSIALEQNYPNPFNPTTAINYQLSSFSFVSLKVYNILGKKIAVLVNKEQAAGDYRIMFDGNNLPSGIYFYQLRVGSTVQTKKMVLMK
ncbi:MAG: M4 family metallopeptidase [Bacteroidetes bacterium]|nr:M4 family metallopeptidase [Bacteroidota bacterium]